MMNTNQQLHTYSNGNGHGRHQTAPIRALDTEALIYQLLQAIGEDPQQEGLQRTPNRVARMYQELTAGYDVDPEELVNDALFDVDYSEMVLVKDIEFYSLCQHHLLPFFGRAHVAYLPAGKVIGLSKIPRIVEMYARRLQLQEQMTQQIAVQIDEILRPLGVAVVVEGQHLCSMMRGVQKANASMITSTLLGSFKGDPQLRTEFMNHIK
jgi:GTP cyclohydrolase IA